MCVHCSTLQLNSSAGYSYPQGRGRVSAMRSQHHWRLAGQWKWNMITPPRTNLTLATWKKDGHWKPVGLSNAHQSENSSLWGEYKGTNAVCVRLLKYMKPYWWTDHIFINKSAKKSSYFWCCRRSSTYTQVVLGGTYNCMYWQQQDQPRHLPWIQHTERVQNSKNIWRVSSRISWTGRWLRHF